MTVPDTRFVAYEYMTVDADPTQESLFKDAYRSFGWTIENVERPRWPGAPVTLHLKRDRAVPNKTTLAKAQRQFTTTIETIDHLQRSKTNKASIVAFTTGILGSAALAGSVAFYLSSTWVPFVLLGAVGLVGWALPYFLYNKTRASTAAVVNQEIDRQFDQLYAICEQASALASA
jgi:hypothetical protein